MKIGLSIVGDSLDNFVRYVRQAEEIGVEMVGMGDSQSLYHEMWVRTTLAAVNTRHVRVGTWCTNPVTRHPAVTASAIATIDELAGGRAFLGIAPGDSAVYNIGHRPASLRPSRNTSRPYESYCSKARPPGTAETQVSRGLADTFPSACLHPGPVPYAWRADSPISFGYVPASSRSR